LARAKQTGRAEARRRYRQSTAPIQEDGEGELLEAADDAPARSSTPAQVRSPDKARPAESRPPTGRLGFTESLRRAYHPVNLREDIRTLPMTLRSRGFLAAVAMVIAGGVAWYLYPVYSGSLMAWQLLVLPGSALAPQLVAGFFAPRASYLLGLLVGVVQPIVYLVVNSSPPVQAAYLARGVDIPGITVDQVALAFFNAIVMGGLFAAMAAWYRRFLSYSSQRTAEARAAANRRSSGSSGKAPQRRTAGR
jgi:uncharacterized integral membrane protein